MHVRHPWLTLLFSTKPSEFFGHVSGEWRSTRAPPPERGTSGDMRIEPRLALLALGLPLLSQALWGRQSPSADEALARIHENVGRFETSLPDFLCDERITSRETEDGKTKSETVTDSIFVGTQHKNKNFTFTESREIMAVNGKKVSKGTTLRGPYFYLGGFSSILVTVFGPKWAPYHDYKVVGMETVAGRTLLAIEFATKEGQTAIRQTFTHKGQPPNQANVLASKYTGKAWIDPQSMQVVRLERHDLNLPPTVRSVVISTEYAVVTIDGKPFWMPKTMRAENVESLRKSKPPADQLCIAEYSNYRKFDVSIGIKY
jgi:hypothetical protein